MATSDVSYSTTTGYQRDTSDACPHWCGHVAVEESSRCGFKLGSSCEGSCYADSMVAQCRDLLLEECGGACEGSKNVAEACTEICSDTCEQSCAEPLSAQAFLADCEMSCLVRSEPSCLNSDKACVEVRDSICSRQCGAACQGSLEGDCRAGCNGTCFGQCETAGLEYIECQRDCQEPSVPGCIAELQVQCLQDCQSADGAWFCDGQYAGATEDTDECAQLSDSG